MKISNIKINNIKEPIGYLFEGISISFEVESLNGSFIKSSRIKVSLDESFNNVIYDTDYKDDIKIYSHIIDIKLNPRTRYYVSVECINDCLEKDIEYTFFETGKMNESFDGKWLTIGNKKSFPIFFKNFELNKNKEVLRSRLYITGLGLFTPYLNNIKIGDEYLTPYLNDYNEWIQILTFDCNSYLKENNTLEVKLGDGWYKGPYGYLKRDVACYKDEFALIYELIIEYTDGTTQKIVSDKDVLVKESNILYSTIYNGEVRDDTYKEDNVYQSIEFDGPSGKLTDRLSTPVKVKEIVKPIEIIKTIKNETVIDFGQNLTGIFRLNVKNKKIGSVIHLEFGEILQNGCFYKENYRKAKSEYFYTSDGIDKDIIPEFTFYGYRYCKVEGYDDISIDDIDALVIYSEIKQIGYINTSNEYINKLINNSLWSLKDNFVDIPSDCPQRDERLGWTGDAQVFCNTAMYLTDSYAFYNKYLYDIREEQRSLDGLVPIVIPSFGVKNFATVWSDAATIIPDYLYKHSGNINILKNCYQSMKDWVDFVVKYDAESDYDKMYHFGDWLALDAPFNEEGIQDRIGSTDRGYICYTYLYYSLLIVSKTASLLYNKEDEIKYLELSNKYKKLVIDRYFDNEGNLLVNTQTAYILAIRYNLSKNIESLKDGFIKLYKENNNSLTTGFVGTPLLCPTLSSIGLNDIAMDLILKEDYPGWIYPIKLGATTIWERWNSVLPDGSMNPQGMNSLNHYAYGSITEWFFNYLLGIKQTYDSIGFEKVIIEPFINKKFKYVDGSFNSVSGKYSVSWKYISDKKVSLKVVVPFNTTVKVVVSSIVKKPLVFDNLTSGIYEYIIDCDK